MFGYIFKYLMTWNIIVSISASDENGYNLLFTAF